MSNKMDSNKTINGTFGKVWLDGELLAECVSFEAKITIEYEDIDIAGDLAKHKKQIGWKTKPIKENKFGMFAYTTVGYRYTSKKGFQFRAGVMPAVAFAFKGIHDHKVVLAPYISFGKAF